MQLKSKKNLIYSTLSLLIQSNLLALPNQRMMSPFTAIKKAAHSLGMVRSGFVLFPQHGARVIKKPREVKCYEKAANAGDPGSNKFLKKF